MFDADETPILRDAFARAWSKISEGAPSPMSDRSSAALRSRLAGVILDLASDNALDSDALACAAIEKCQAMLRWSAPTRSPAMGDLPLS
jgi:hypothetical protein